MSVLVTAMSRHIYYILDITGRFCFSLPEDFTVKHYFCIFIFVGKFRILQRGLAHVHFMRLPL